MVLKANQESFPGGALLEFEHPILAGKAQSGVDGRKMADDALMLRTGADILVRSPDKIYALLLDPGRQSLLIVRQCLQNLEDLPSTNNPEIGVMNGLDAS